jgi:hypothetical protein
MKQKGLTLITPVIESSHQLLHAELDKIKKELIDEKAELFENIGSIHFARWILLEPTELDGEKINARLAFSSNYDDEHEEHIAALASVAGSFMDRIYQYCEGYPSLSGITPAQRRDYLVKWKVKNAAFYTGAPGRTLAQIKNESSLRDFLRREIDSERLTGQKAAVVHRQLKQKVLSQEEFLWTKEKAKLPSVNYFGLFLLGIVLLVLFIPIVIWLLIIQFFYELKDVPLGLTPSQVSEPHIKKLEAYEDLENQNQFTQVLVMKKGIPRKITLNGFLLFAKELIANLFVRGKLMGIPTIHFARWVMIDGGRRMLFLSNFDGSWQQYLGDFIDKSGWGLTAIWSNSVGFPKTKFTFFDGAYDEEHFLAWSRYYEIPTQVWYSAYPQLSIKNIVNNSLIRKELMQNLDEKKAARFLNRF